MCPLIQLAIETALNADKWISSEKQFQECTARLLDALGLLWFHPANERKCTPKQGAALKRAGVKAGVPDVMIFDTPPSLDVYPSKGCAIELKYGKNRLTPAQKQWQADLKNNGWDAVTAHSMADVVAILGICGYIKC